MKNYISILCYVIIITNLAFTANAAAPFFTEKFYCIGNKKRAVTLRLQVAETREQLAYGLMFRRTLVPFDGMIFRLGKEHIPRMWMKNTYLPLDMLFIDKSGKVVQKIENTVPMSEALILSNVPVTAVIELEAGRAAREQWDIGTKLKNGSCAARAAHHQS
jgi:uncharacterized membrane protein (UPF0127 family)